MKTVLKFRFWAVMMIAAVVFASCNKDEDLIIDEGTEQDADIVAVTFDGSDGGKAIDKAALTVTTKASDEVDSTTLAADSTNTTATAGGKAPRSKITLFGENLKVDLFGR
jgi:hypothetical protein